jgi:hypothetical protein
MFRLIAINFSQKSPHFSLLSPTSPCKLSEREVTSPSNLKVVGALSYTYFVFLLCFGISLSCAPYVASFSGLSIFDCHFGILQRLFRWFNRFLCWFF